jgi:ferredoxin
MKVSLLSDRCVGAGQCVLSAPGAFDQDEEDGIAFVLDSAPSTDVAAVHEAADLCPARAILVHDDDGRAV